MVRALIAGVRKPLPEAMVFHSSERAAVDSNHLPPRYFKPEHVRHEWTVERKAGCHVV